jgi:hypothetical protein
MGLFIGKELRFDSANSTGIVNRILTQQSAPAASVSSHVTRFI